MPLLLGGVALFGGLGFALSAYYPQAVDAMSLLTATAAAAGGLALLGLLREVSRSTIVSPQSLTKHRGYAVLGAAPDLTPRALRELPPDQRSPLGCLAYLPASPFATAFRDLQGNLECGRVVAFTGAAAGEGATLSALCTAASAAQQGRRVVLVDCDLRRRAITKGFGMEPDLGVLEACERPEYWAQYLEHETETGLHMIPAAKPSSPWRSLVSEAGFTVLLRRLRESYDLVVLDCPPLLSSAEGPVLARLADTTVMVATWDRTRLGAIRAAMKALRPRPRAQTAIYVNRVPNGYRFGRLRPD